jgi:hypothetical protein
MFWNQELNKNFIKTYFWRVLLIIWSLLWRVGSLILFIAGLLYIVKNISSENSKLMIEFLQVLVWPITVIIGTTLLKEKLIAILHGRPVSVKTPIIEFALGTQDIPLDTVPELVKEEIKSTVKAVESTTVATTTNTDEATALLQVALLFEKIYNNIYGGQLVTLTNLRRTVEGYWHIGLEAWYAEFRETDPLIKVLPFSDYIGYLLRTELIRSAETPQGRKYYITDKGTDFLNYIEKSGYSIFKPH